MSRRPAAPTSPRRAASLAATRCGS
jgi:hypothetical protein